MARASPVSLRPRHGRAAAGGAAALQPRRGQQTWVPPCRLAVLRRPQIHGSTGWSVQGVVLACRV
eukprot:4770042-Alexandrium_andersonii.AAC.1